MPNLLVLILSFVACQKKEQLKEDGASKTKSISSQTPAPQVISKDLAPSFNASSFFDSIGPGWNGDFNGDGISDTVMAVHVRSAQQMETVPFRKEVLDTTSPGEDLCGGWGVFMLLSKKDSPHWDRVYFCGQQSRVQTYNWVGSARLDTLQQPDLKSKVGKEITDVVSLFSQAGITVYLYFDGKQFKIFEPNEEP